jgi:tetratricopeptide (TPR) repeat protein/transcriptional regulator with XRE-family HTH domain
MAVNPVGAGADYDDFGDLLRYLRRKARLTQRALGLAVGYSEAQISRLEQRRRPPDPAAVAALFVPALRLPGQSATGRRLVELAKHARQATQDRVSGVVAADRAEIPPAPEHAVRRVELLDRLAALLAAERRVVISGLPGAGKTTLAAALARDRAGERGVCWLTLTSGVTLTVPAVVRRLALFLVRHGESGVEPVIAAGVDQPLALDERLRLLASGLAARPTLLCLDNGHLLAEAPDVLEVLTHLLATTATELLVPSRIDLRLPGTASLRVGGLRPAEGRELVARLARLPATVADPLVTRTEGNPMLIRLALGQLRAGGDDPVEFVERLETRPEIAGYLLDTTIGGLTGDGRRLVELIAVFRHPVDLFDTRLIELSHRFVGRHDVLAGMTELQHRQLLALPAEAALHPLVRDRVRAELATDPVRQRQLHRVAAAWYEGAADEIIEAAWHHLRADDHAAAARLLATRTHDLIDLGQAGEAVELLGEVHDQPGFDRWPGLLAKADLLAQTERAGEAEAAYRAALARAGAGRAQVAVRLAEHLLLRGRPAEALTLCDASVEAPRLLAARLAAARCRALMQTSDYVGTLRAGERALELLATDGSESGREAAEITARVHSALGAAHRRLGNRDRAVVHLRQSVATATAAGLRTLSGRAMFSLGALQVDTGRLAEAEASYAEAMDVVRAAGDFHCLARVLHATGVVRHFRGEPAAAVELHEESLAIQQRIGDLGAVLITQLSMALALLALDDADRAEKVLASALSERQATDDRWQRAHALDALAMIRLVADGGLTSGVVGPLSEAREIVLAIGGDPQLLAMIAVHTALGELADDRPARAAALLAATEIAPDYDVLPVEAEFVRGATALAIGTRAETLAAVRRMTDLIDTSGHRMYAPATRRLRAAAQHPPPPADWPRLLWVLGRGRPATATTQPDRCESPRRNVT